MNGIVVGGWEFVWAAYGLTAIALLSYGVMVITRAREQRRRAEATPDRG
jgi:heme exporter protein CcmD